MQRILFAVLLVVECAAVAAADFNEETVSAILRGEDARVPSRTEQGDPYAQGSFLRSRCFLLP